MADKHLKRARFITTQTPTESAGEYLAQQIIARLQSHQTVAWFLSGGSSVAAAVEASRRMRGADLARLSVTLADERFGPPGSSDSNWKLLLESGFKLTGARLMPVLDGSDFERTIDNYEALVAALFDSDYCVALLGLGEDGHTAGILPGSPVLKSDRLASGYDSPDYRRLTIAPKALIRLDEAVVYASGESKRQALVNLHKDLAPDVQPAQILKAIPALSVYNDLEGASQ